LVISTCISRRDLERRICAITRPIEPKGPSAATGVIARVEEEKGAQASGED
jgi:hypothetical protein